MKWPTSAQGVRRAVLEQASNEIAAALLGAAPYDDNGGEWCASAMIASILAANRALRATNLAVSE